MTEKIKNLSEMKKLKKELNSLRKERDKYLAGWQRARADHLNYVKDEKERTQKLLEYANISLIFKLLALLDSFESAHNSIPQDLIDNEIVKGFLQIKKQLEEVLKGEGLEEIPAKIGDRFDPNIHEIIDTAEEGDFPLDTIVEISRKGYRIRDKIIRPVQIRVSKVEESSN